jgi:hypothetical protein
MKHIKIKACLKRRTKITVKKETPTWREYLEY